MQMLADIEQLIENCEKYKLVKLYNEYTTIITNYLYNKIYEIQNNDIENMKNVEQYYSIIEFILKSPFPFPQCQLGELITLLVDLYIDYI